ncbi:hypothetical protein B296_00043311 [Ensete ventricosum]|uniref:Uncharacterized protein n=1 Tax=Ensete ventricosum TaxID=4639 RepID=A0A426XJZ1_ENSVE|nr:hypothetical protein B296_00043311 [Ensete ventricosum]
MRSTATIADARRKKRREEEGCEQDMLFVSRKQRDPGMSRDLEHSQARCLRERWQGRRPLVPMLPKRWRGRRLRRWPRWEPRWGILLEIYSSEIDDAKVAAAVAALVVRNWSTAAASQRRDK